MNDFEKFPKSVTLVQDYRGAMYPETMLWMAVLKKAIDDAVRVCQEPGTTSKENWFRYGRRVMRRKLARSWLGGESCEYILNLLGIEQSWFMRNLERMHPCIFEEV